MRYRHQTFDINPRQMCDLHATPDRLRQQNPTARPAAAIFRQSHNAAVARPSALNPVQHSGATDELNPKARVERANIAARVAPAITMQSRFSLTTKVLSESAVAFSAGYGTFGTYSQID